MGTYYKLEIGYNGADVSDIATIVEVEEPKAKWLTELIQSGFQEQQILSGFVNIEGKEETATFTRNRLISSETKLPSPKESATA